MNIVHINPKFHPVIGGGETYLYDLALILTKAGHSLTIVTAPHDGRILSDYPFEVIEVEGLSDEFPQPNLALPGLHKCLNSIAPDVIHVHGFMSYWMLMPFIPAFKNARIILSIHSTPHIPERIFGTFKQYDSEVLFAKYILQDPSIKKIFVGSQYYADSLRSVVPGANITVLPFFVVADNFPYKPLRKTSDEHRLLFASRIIERKGIFDALEALCLLPNHYKLVLPAYDKTSRDAVHLKVARFIESNKLAERVILYDKPVMFSAMPKEHDNVFATLMPSHYEGFGIALLESMSSGTPIVATDIPGINEVLIKQKTGLLVPPHDPNAIKEAVLSFEDSELRHKIIMAARNRAEEVYSPTKHLEILLDSYTANSNG